MNEMNSAVLIVDDKPNMLRLMTKVLRPVTQVYTAGDGAGAIAVLDQQTIDVVLCDLRMPDMTGIDVLRHCKHRQPRAEFILMTAYASVDTAVAALKEGAYDYLTKPFEPEEAKAIVLRALHSAPPRDAVAKEDEILPNVHARSRAMRDLAMIARQIAPTEINVHIAGESGCGKRQIARAVHTLSPHAEHPFVALDCRTVEPTTLLRQFVNHTGGVEPTQGEPRRAIGTLLLEDIDALDSSAQAALLHALEQRSPELKPPQSGTRLITTTQCDLDAVVAEGRLRRDLSFPLRVATLNIPPLRSRREDIPVLAAHLLMESKRAGLGGADTGFAAGVMERLVALRWPGNIRELRSVIEHAIAVVGEGRIGLEALPDWVRAESSIEVPWDTLTWADAVTRGRADVARHYLVALLKRFDGDVVTSATHAAVERESFYRLLRRHGIQPESFRSHDDPPQRRDEENE